MMEVFNKGASASPLLAVDSGASTCYFSALPSALLAHIFSRLPRPCDAAAALCTSRWMQATMVGAPLQLRVAAGPAHDINTSEREKGERIYLAVGVKPHGAAHSASQLDVTWVNNMLSSIRKYMQGTEELDMSGCAVLDTGVSALLSDLHHLDRLILDNCQKLTSSCLEDMARRAIPAPRVLSLQRCFRLSSTATSNLLKTAGKFGSRLECLLLSHLEQLEIGQEMHSSKAEIGMMLKSESAILNIEGSQQKLGGLRLLALHCCNKVGNFQLQGLALACPQLEVLLLGGSTAGFDLACPEEASSLSIAEAADSLVELVRKLAMLRILEITFFGKQVCDIIRSQVNEGLLVWDFSSADDVLDATEVVSGLECRSKQSVAHFLGPERSILDIQEVRFSHCLSLGKSTVLEPEEHEEGKEVLEVEVEQQGEVDGEEKEEEKGERDDDHLVRRSRLSITGGLANSVSFLRKGWGPREEGDLLIALKAAVNCSDARRRTPLHIAAQTGDAEMAAGLLVLGASAVGVKDGRGSSALFWVAEVGDAEVIKVLLKAGAEPLSRNRAGENSLYIAALKGHVAATDAMVAHCMAAGLPWQDPASYGDGWTPLMAAAVADRQDVGVVLLSAVASSGINPLLSRTDLGTPSSSAAASIVQNSELVSLLNARNRYGQTALHIAARQASVWFVARLLEAGASPRIQDAYGDKAVDVAAKEGHSEIVAILQAAEEQTSPRQLHAGELVQPSKRSHPEMQDGMPSIQKSFIGCPSTPFYDAGSMLQEGRREHGSISWRSYVCDRDEGTYLGDRNGYCGDDGGVWRQGHSQGRHAPVTSSAGGGLPWLLEGQVRQGAQAGTVQAGAFEWYRSGDSEAYWSQRGRGGGGGAVSGQMAASPPQAARSVTLPVSQFKLSADAAPFVPLSSTLK